MIVYLILFFQIDVPHLNRLPTGMSYEKCDKGMRVPPIDSPDTQLVTTVKYVSDQCLVCGQDLKQAKPYQKSHLSDLHDIQVQKLIYVCTGMVKEEGIICSKDH